MIFAHTHEWVVGVSPHTGLPKTQTRRNFNYGQYFSVPDEHGCIQEVGNLGAALEERPLWRVGHTYAVQPGRGKHSVGRIEITAIRYCERAGDITPEDAIAEGFASPDEFRDVYGRINGVEALERPAWALTFALVKEGAQ